MSDLIKVLKDKKERFFNVKILYCFRCVQVLNKLKNGCPQPAHPVSRLKKPFLLNSLKLPTYNQKNIKIED